MTRKDYNRVALVIHFADVSEKQRLLLAQDMAALIGTNKIFDARRFMLACIPESSPYYPIAKDV